MSKTATIIHTTDSYDCETCGGSYEDSVQLEIDGTTLGISAYAHCFGGQSSTYEDLLKALLEHLGYSIEEVYQEEDDSDL